MPDAFIVAADTIAVGVLQAFTAAGVLVPRDTSVISINNQAIAQYTSPTLTSYDIDQNELADTAITPSPVGARCTTIPSSPPP